MVAKESCDVAGHDRVARDINSSLHLLPCPGPGMASSHDAPWICDRDPPPARNRHGQYLVLLHFFRWLSNADLALPARSDWIDRFVLFDFGIVDRNFLRRPESSDMVRHHQRASAWSVFLGTRQTMVSCHLRHAFDCEWRCR